jgi:hypothetical protein
MLGEIYGELRLANTLRAIELRQLFDIWPDANATDLVDAILCRLQEAGPTEDLTDYLAERSAPVLCEDCGSGVSCSCAVNGGCDNCGEALGGSYYADVPKYGDLCLGCYERHKDEIGLK